MSDQTSITVSRTIDAPTHEVFDVLSNPHRHVELDGSGFIRSVDQADRVTAVGQVFSMNMEGDHMGGEYQTENHVTGYEQNRRLAWQTAPAGQQPPGWQWVWELTPQGPDSTEVELTYDWSSVTDKALLAKLNFPLVEQEQLDASLAKLAEAVAA